MMTGREHAGAEEEHVEPDQAARDLGDNEVGCRECSPSELAQTSIVRAGRG